MHLKRFDFSFAGKLSHFVSYPETLSLKSFVAPANTATAAAADSTDSSAPVHVLQALNGAANDNDTTSLSSSSSGGGGGHKANSRERIAALRNTSYKLYGVLVHLGYTSHSGHYYSYVRGPNDTWYKADDTRISVVQLRDVLSQNAYILFYTRIDSDASGKSAPLPPANALNAHNGTTQQRFPTLGNNANSNSNGSLDPLGHRLTASSFSSPAAQSSHNHTAANSSNTSNKISFRISNGTTRLGQANGTSSSSSSSSLPPLLPVQSSTSVTKTSSSSSSSSTHTTSVQNDVDDDDDDEDEGKIASTTTTTAVGEYGPSLPPNGALTTIRTTNSAKRKSDDDDGDDDQEVRPRPSKLLSSPVKAATESAVVSSSAVVDLSYLKYKSKIERLLKSMKKLRVSASKSDSGKSKPKTKKNAKKKIKFLRGLLREAHAGDSGADDEKESAASISCSNGSSSRSASSHSSSSSSSERREKKLDVMRELRKIKKFLRRNKKKKNKNKNSNNGKKKKKRTSDDEHASSSEQQQQQQQRAKDQASSDDDDEHETTTAAAATSARVTHTTNGNGISNGHVKKRENSFDSGISSNSSASTSATATSSSNSNSNDAAPTFVNKSSDVNVYCYNRSHKSPHAVKAASGSFNPYGKPYDLFSELKEKSASCTLKTWSNQASLLVSSSSSSNHVRERADSYNDYYNEEFDKPVSKRNNNNNKTDNNETD